MDEWKQHLANQRYELAFIRTKLEVYNSNLGTLDAIRCSLSEIQRTRG